jgi:hypothetical protein
MSAIASFIEIPASALEELRRRAVPQKRISPRPKDEFGQFLRARGREVVRYGWSGYVLSTLVPYLAEKHRIDLQNSERSELAGFLSDARGAWFLALSPRERASYLNDLDPGRFSEEEMRDYFNEFNASDDVEMGRAMLDGIIAIREALRQLEDDHVVLMIVG